MKEPILIVVHPGYALSSYTSRGMKGIEELYGNYGMYLWRLEEELKSRSNVIIIPEETGNKMPFDFDRKAEVIRNSNMLAARLRRADEKKEICGEFLWAYHSLLFPEPHGCCVLFYRNAELRDFEVKLRRDLCYPTVDCVGMSSIVEHAWRL